MNEQNLEKVTVEFSAKTLKMFNEIVSRYPKREGAMLPVLYLAQEEFGYLSPAAIEYVAGLMGVSSARVYGVVTFYTMLKMKPVGRYHIQVCRTLPCALKGSEQITDCLKERVGLGLGQTTADGKFTVSEVECLASCGTAPVMQINDDYYESLTVEKVEKIVDNLE